MVEMFGARAARVLAIKLLDWLRLGRRLRNTKPMVLNPHYPWCNNLISWLDQEDSVKIYFYCKNNRFNFLPDVPLKKIDEIKVFVRKHYCPRLMI
jgi:hypothetical protein